MAFPPMLSLVEVPKSLEANLVSSPHTTPIYGKRTVSSRSGGHSMDAALMEVQPNFTSNQVVVGTCWKNSGCDNNKLYEFSNDHPELQKAEHFAATASGGGGVLGQSSRPQQATGHGFSFDQFPLKDYQIWKSCRSGFFMSQLHNTSRVTAKPRVPSTSLHFGLSKIDISTGGYAPPPNFSEKIGLRFLISLGSFLTDGALMEVQPNFTSNPALMVVQPNCRSNLRKHANKCKDNCVQQEVSDGQGAAKSLFSKTMKCRHQACVVRNSGCGNNKLYSVENLKKQRIKD
ncbi:hypothetical protein LWI29_021572 [Acer saccharum]|uniref:Uncharacterized protein n=1 Tax=Acer saccharum TaxID=4024 RepID=A0AA39VBZ1_ACESA|nr:hypothetical protein LWI29_021572 [Acer saccharum]